MRGHWHRVRQQWRRLPQHGQPDPERHLVRQGQGGRPLPHLPQVQGPGEGRKAGGRGLREGQARWVLLILPCCGNKSRIAIFSQSLVFLGGSCSSASSFFSACAWGLMPFIPPSPSFLPPLVAWGLGPNPFFQGGWIHPPPPQGTLAKNTKEGLKVNKKRKEEVFLVWNSTTVRNETKVIL